MFKVNIVWDKGDADMHQSYEFATQAELDAFCYGVIECDGWLDHSMMSDTEYAEYLAEIDSDDPPTEQEQQK